MFNPAPVVASMMFRKRMREAEEKKKQEQEKILKTVDKT